MNFGLNDKKTYLITDEIERKYFSKIDIAEGYLILGKTSAYFSDARYFTALKEKLKDSTIEPKLFTGFKDISKFLKSLSVKKLYLNYDKTTLSEYEEYKRFNVKILDGTKDIKLSRMVKREEEISCIKKACEIAESAYHKVISEIKIGDTENQVAVKLKKEMLKLGAEDLSFSTIVAFNENSAVPHHQTGDKKLENNSVILIDMGCKYKGYCSDLTRTAFIGTPSKEFIDNYNLVLKANETAEKEITAGMTGKSADKIARDILKEKGLDKFFTHSLGHGVGLEIHEVPSVSKRGDIKLKENTVFTVEPGVYFEGKYGIRIEDTVMIENGKVVRLFNDEKKLIII